MTLLTTTFCLLTLSAVHQEPAPEEARLDRFAGEYEVRHRTWSSDGGQPVVSTATATWKRSNAGRYMNEYLRSAPAGHPLEVDTWIAWRPRAKHYVLLQNDVPSSVAHLLEGTWDEERGRLTFFDPEVHGRWEYGFEDDGSIVLEVRVADEEGGLRLAADYHYYPVGKGHRGPRAPQETTLAGTTRVPMIEGFNWVVVDVKINDNGPFRMILDTGAGVTVLNEDLVQELGLDSEGTRRIGDPAHPDAHEVDVITIDSIALGSARFEGVAGVGWRGASLVSMGGIRGVLGFPTFSECLLTLDYPGAVVEVSTGSLPAPDGKRILPMKTDGTPSIPIEVAGIPLDGHLDAGNMGSLALPASLKERMPIVPGSEGQGAATRGGTPVMVSTAQLDGPIRLGSAEVNSPHATFDDSLIHVNVGHAILSRFAVTLDQRNGRLRLADPAPDAPRKPKAAVQRRMGVQMSMKNGTVFTAAMIVPGSAGEAAGLQVGDQLLEVDGEPLTQERLVAALRGTGPFSITIERDGERKAVTLFSDE